MPGLDVAALAVLVAATGAAISLHLNAKSVATARRAARRPRTWIIGVPTLLVLLLLGGPLFYSKVIIGSAPAPLSFDDLPAASSSTPTAPPRSASAVASDAPGTAAPTPGDTPEATSATVAAGTTTPGEAATIETASSDSPIDGAWTVGEGSQAGYSIDDTVLLTTTRVVGRTSNVSGSATVTGTSATDVRVVVDMASVMCNCVHDGKYREMLEVERYPTSTFELTSPVSVDSIPPEGTIVTIPVAGRFTIHGVTRDVSFPLEAVQRDGRIAVNGSLPVVLEDYGIENPDAGALGRLDNAQIDLLLAFDRTS